MIILALDAVSAGASAAVMADGRLRGHARHEARHGQAEHLMGLVAEGLRQAGLRAGAVDLIAATRGPGSFTGIRVTLAAARGLAMATGRPLLGLAANDVVALMATASAPATDVPGMDGATLVTAIESRRAEVFMAAYRSGPEADPQQRLSAPLAALTPDAARSRLADLAGLAGTGGVQVAGCAASRLLADWNGRPATVRQIGDGGPDAVALARLAALRVSPGATSGAAIAAIVAGTATPLYLRPPQLGGARP
ncbi:MAG: tRNA (adenosine(37)-N6)-threonylcarbamoyltransferase complex dimerization subunit type 1 TsaB [Alphaproteobacteria bacterium]